MLYTYCIYSITWQKSLLRSHLRYSRWNILFLDESLSFYLSLDPSNSVYFRLSPSMSVYPHSILFKSGREVISLSVYLLPPLKGQGPGEWRNILRTKHEKGALGMYLLLHPFPTALGYISWGLRLCDCPPYPSTTWTSLRRPVLSPSL
jgi:hypothetical protein